MRITNKQERFCQLVVTGKTYAEAYREAYPVSKKWKDTSVWCESSKLMTNTMVLQRVEELQYETQERNQASLNEVLNEMSNWLRLDPLDLFDENDCIKSMKDLPENARKSIASFEVTELFASINKVRTKIGELKRIKFIDKRAISDQFLRKMGAYIDRKVIEMKDLSHLEDLLDGIEG